MSIHDQIHPCKRKTNKNPTLGRCDPAYGVRRLYLYDPNTGIVAWKNDHRQFKRGQRAGSWRRDGRRDLSINDRAVPEHRVCWFLYYGRWPDHDIDHINGNPSDNRLCNLREATRSQNLGNAKLYKSNKTGFRGVSYNAKDEVYVAKIQVRKKLQFLGRFKSANAAAEAYQNAAKAGFGKFARPCFTAKNAATPPILTGPAEALS